ncbi:MAG: S1C family serine protease [Acidimicrobiales bacterium]
MNEPLTPQPWPPSPDLGPTPEPDTTGTPTEVTPPPTAARWRTGMTAVVVAAVLAGGVGGAVGTVVADGGSGTGSAGARPSSDVEARSIALAGEVLDVAGVVEAVGPATVTIQTRLGGRTGAGTGIVVTSDGEVLTNAHVVEGADSIDVRLPGEATSRSATVIGSDQASDLALLRIDGVSGLDVATLGSSSSLAVGDDVVAIGNALALRGGPTVTRGIVSALDRSLDTRTGTMVGLVQTDASISSGNSGGPLVNAAGEVIGINTAVATSRTGSSAENIGFAIAIDQALPVIERLRAGDEAGEPGFLGVTIADPTDASRGAVVATVAPGSPAEEAGIEPGDLVTAVDGVAVDGASSLVAVVGRSAPGDSVVVDVIRDGEDLRLSVRLAARSIG